MNISKNKIIKIAAMLLFFVCMVFANFYAIRKMASLAVELYLYDKLSVAYNIGAAAGLETELEKILASDKFSRELMLVRDFKAKLKDLKNPGIFLDGKVAQSKRRITFIRNLRSIAIILMFFILFWRLFVNLSARKKKIAKI